MKNKFLFLVLVILYLSLSCRKKDVSKPIPVLVCDSTFIEETDTIPFSLNYECSYHESIFTIIRDSAELFSCVNSALSIAQNINFEEEDIIFVMFHGGIRTHYDRKLCFNTTRDTGIFKVNEFDCTGYNLLVPYVFSYKIPKISNNCVIKVEKKKYHWSTPLQYPEKCQ